MIQELALGIIIVVIAVAAGLAVNTAVSPHEDDPQEKYRFKQERD